MSGPRIGLRTDAEARYPHLHQFFACYFHEDWPVFHGSPEGAIDDGIAGNPLEALKEIRSELAALLATTAEDTRLRAVLNDGLGVNLSFRKAAAARAFAQDVEQRLLCAIAAKAAARRSKGKK